MIPGAPMSLSTLHRVVASLVRDGLANAVRDSRRLVVKTPGCTFRVLFEGPNPAFPHPREFRGGVIVGRRRVLQDPVELLEISRLDWPPERIQAVCSELQSSVHHAATSATFRRPAPRLGDPALAWEGAVVEGHPTHPGHRCRLGLSLTQAYLWGAEIGGFMDLCFVRPPRLQVHGPFWELLEGWLPPDSFPVHPAQAILLGHAPEAMAHPATVEQLRWTGLEPPTQQADHDHDHGHQHTVHAGPPVELPLHWIEARRRAWAQASLHTVCPQELPYHLKLSLGVTTPDTLCPHSVVNAPRVSALLERIAPEGLHVVRELASASLVHEDRASARPLSCIVRADPERELEGEALVLCAALVESDEAGQSLLPRVSDDPATFVHRYARLLLEAMLPLLRRGVALGCNGQHTLARFRDGELVGFAVRDFGGVRIHRPTLGEPLDLHPGSTADAASLEQVWATAHHSLIQMHLGEIIRALEALHPGLATQAWAQVRALVDEGLSGEAQAWWTAPTVPHRCFLRMRLDGSGRELTRPRLNPLVHLSSLPPA